LTCLGRVVGVVAVAPLARVVVVVLLLHGCR